MPTNAINYHQTHPSAKKDRSTSPTGKGQGKESEQETVTVAVVNIANHRPRTTSEKLLQFETSMTSHLKAERNLEQIRRSRMPMKCVIAFESVLPSEKKSINFSCHSLERAKFRDTIPSLSAIQTSGENGRSSNAPPTKVHKTKLLQKVCHLQRRRAPRQAWRYIPKKGCTSSTVALRYTSWDYLLGITEKRRLFDIRATNLDFQIANDIVVSDTHAKVYINELGASLWIHVVKDSPSVLSLGTPCN